MRRVQDNNFNLIRMLAAAGVMFTHAPMVVKGVEAPQPLQGSLMGLSLGTLCVYAFFTISGYLLAKSLNSNPCPARFMKRRAKRILPGLLFATVVSIIIGLLFTTSPAADFWRVVPEFVGRNVLMISFTQGLPGVFGNNPVPFIMNIPLWSLPYEVVCYGALLLFSIIGLRAEPVFFILCVLSALLVLSLSGMFGQSTALSPAPVEIILRYGYSFVIGVALWLSRDRLPMNALMALVAIGLIVIGVKSQMFLNPLLQSGLAYLVIYAAQMKIPVLASYNRFGDYSYGTYLLGFPVQQAIYASGLGTSVALNLLISLPVTILLAFISWNLVEKRFL